MYFFHFPPRHSSNEFGSALGLTKWFAFGLPFSRFGNDPAFSNCMRPAGTFFGLRALGCRAVRGSGQRSPVLFADGFRRLRARLLQPERDQNPVFLMS